MTCRRTRAAKIADRQFTIARHVSTTQSAWARGASAICQAARTRFERVPRKKTKHPIEHVVIIVKENHGFDNYFGTFPGANGARLPRSPNPPTRDHPHTHAAWLARQTTATREQFIEQDIPVYFSYARKFCLCDNYYTDVAGPSTPNHLMLLCADSPIIDNPSRGAPQTIKIDASLPKSLEQSRLTWRSYGGYANDFL